MVTVFEMAGLPVGQITFEVSSHVTASLFDGVKLYVALFEPTLIPFTFHWYAGVEPPLVGAAVYVTMVPEQTGLDDGDTEMLIGKFGFTVMLTVLDIAGLPV